MDIEREIKKLEKGCEERVCSDNTPYAPSYHICRNGMICKNCSRKIKELEKEETAP